MALTKVGLGSMFIAAAVVVAVALPISTLVIVVTWWSAAHEQLRAVLELLPESVVARTADGSGQPWPVAGVVLLLTVGAVAFLSVSRRRAIKEAGRSTASALGLGLGRAAVLIGGVGLAATAGPIATGADLREEPTVFADPWHVVVVVVLVLAYAWLGTRHVAVRMRAHGADCPPERQLPGQPSG